MAFSLTAYPDFSHVHDQARSALASGTPLVLKGLQGCHYTPQRLDPETPPVLVFPGSGNHYLGMGRALSVQWPAVWRAANRATERFAAQCRAERLVPYRADWRPGWQAEALAAVAADPVTAICGQVVFGCLATDLLRGLGISAAAVIGYSLGETVGYFATGAWPDRGRMLARLEASELFRRELAGPCRAVRRMLPIPDEAPVDWRTAVVNRSAAWVGERLGDYPSLRLLIVNTPEECVIGGHGPALEAFIRRQGCEAVPLQGVVAVHCEAVQPVAEAYRDLHRFPTHPPSGIAYYSCARGERIDLSTESAADSLLRQALEGFDFPSVVESAYADGRRLFLEVGPQASCTRMIDRILGERPHRALSINSDPANETASLARALAVLAAEGLPVDLTGYFPAAEPLRVSAESDPAGRMVRPRRIVCGGRPLDPPPPPAKEDASPRQSERDPGPDAAAAVDAADAAGLFFDRTRSLVRQLTEGATAAGQAHRSFLALSADLGRQYVEALDLQNRLARRALEEGLLDDLQPMPLAPPDAGASPPRARDTAPRRPPKVAFDRAMCMEFAVGSAARVLGPEFAVVDTFPARVRLPDAPLMLVDRILSVEGQKGVLGPGRLVTEHDVLPGAWYLDGGRAPVCIAVEAGQADLFLSAYLGIDLQVKGERTYRLLDAAVTFHRGLPRPGEVIRYAIEIEKFIRQGPTWLFFFRFEGTIDGRPLITMRNGCAGFFTTEEVRRSGGILLTEEDRRPQPGVAPDDWQPLVPLAAAAYDDDALEALRRGALDAGFGPAFKGIRLPENLRLPGGRMALIDRVPSLDPAGGRYGLGCIRAEADIDPQAWFLTCHFVDDMVMPGTLMYECCAHTLRIYLQRMGWISDRPEAAYEPVVGRPAVLKCRGPVTPQTRRVIYEVEIREIGFAPEPYVMADAHMYADGHHIVMFRDMSMKLTGMDRAALEAFWKKKARPDGGSPVAESVFSRERLLEFATGRPSLAFGPPYRPFDDGRFIARLPAPPYAFIHRVTQVEPPPWVLAPDGWVQAACDIDPADWYFRSNGAPFLPICVLMEIALQACGFLAAYMGSALKSEKDLHFRNLDGEATLHANVPATTGTLQTRARLLSVNAAGDMLIEHYAFEVRQAGRRVYSGQTSFGFFTAEALAHQAGLPESDQPAATAVQTARPVLLEDTAPLTPDDPAVLPPGRDALPARALRMIDRIEAFDPDGGPRGLGYIRGSKSVDPEEWFFKAHFFQDPVCPGSLGIESLIQLLRFAAGTLWPEALRTHTMGLLTNAAHVWRYRGQILPNHRSVQVEAVITECRHHPHPRLVADGHLHCDGLSIYKLQHFGLELRPSDTA
jgi:3-hydroxymyristoyl/3-hydroxydecanoyl-(acyl carrier protein) dehydratase/malonyl CoA-acyl carrier protein transacylase